MGLLTKINHAVDRIIGIAAPKWALSRMNTHARMDMALSTYQAADRSRRNRDFYAKNISADAAILADAATINARSRALIRDSWVAKSIMLAVQRNIVGRGIVPVPTVMDGNTEMLDTSDAIEKAFWAWASDPNNCDAEGRQTFWQKQALAVAERWAVGEQFIVLSLARVNGKRTLQFQSFEPEQLATGLTLYQGKRIRGGIEVDDAGKAVAYWFYERNPQDYLSIIPPIPRRFPRQDVIHYFKQERTRQTRGVSALAPVMQDIRDLKRFWDATLWAALMEACVGLIFSKQVPTGPSRAIDTGNREIDFKPGMIVETNIGESVTALDPRRPGNTFDPFTRTLLRGVAAGTGLSYEQIARDFSSGTYSSQRQGMLEDWREWRAEQDLLIDLLITPIYVRWLSIAVAEGMIPGISPDDYLANPAMYEQAEYVPDGHEWIDPQKEANAAETMLRLRLTTRKDLAGARGGRWRRIIREAAEEKAQAQKVGITLPEDMPAPLAPAQPGGGADPNANPDAEPSEPGDPNGPPPPTEPPVAPVAPGPRPKAVPLPHDGQILPPSEQDGMVPSD